MSKFCGKIRSFPRYATLDKQMIFSWIASFRSLQVDHQLFALSKLDITGDGREEVIACSWVRTKDHVFIFKKPN